MIELTPRAVAFVLSQEGVVLEAYKDSIGVWTWAGGIAATSGVDVMGLYKDKPQTLDRALRATVDMIRDRYLPGVNRAFAGHALSEAQLAAAISFQWNTGAITKATWVQSFMAGKASARAEVMNWAHPVSITSRRAREQKLFFDGVWPASLDVLLYDVAKPSYRPVHPRLIDMLPTLQAILGGH